MAAFSRRWRWRATPTFSRRASTCTACTTGRRRVGRCSAGRGERYEQATAGEPVQVAWTSSPDAAVATLEVAGAADPRRRRPQRHLPADGRSGAAAGEATGVPFEEMVIPDEIHGFLRYANWLRINRGYRRLLRKEAQASGRARHGQSLTLTKDVDERLARHILHL